MIIHDFHYFNNISFFLLYFRGFHYNDQCKHLFFETQGSDSEVDYCYLCRNFWNLCGLPKDDTSIENGIIIDKGRRWPLMIDPQTQANKYIRKLGQDIPEGIDIIKASSGQLIRQIEQGIQFGKWILVENVGTFLDPALIHTSFPNTVGNSTNITKFVL